MKDGDVPAYAVEDLKMDGRWPAELPAVIICRMISQHVGGVRMDKRLVRAYRERWRAVEAVDSAEQRRSPVGWRLQQMDAIYRLAVGLRLPGNVSSDGKAAVYERWAWLKRHMR